MKLEKVKSTYKDENGVIREYESIVAVSADGSMRIPVRATREKDMNLLKYLVK